MVNDNSPRIKAVDKTLTILETIVELDGATLAEIDERVELSKSSTYNHLQTLLRRQYVEKRHEQYYPGLNCLTLGGAARGNNRLYGQARPVVDTVADETGELAILTTESDGTSIYLYRSEGKNALSTDSYVGCRLPLHCSGAGKVMLAHMDESERDAVIQRSGLTEWTPNTITERSELAAELERIRDQRFALDDEERLVGMRGVATPIQHRETEEMLGTLGVSGPTSRVQGKWFREELPELLRQNADVIEVNMTYS